MPQILPRFEFVDDSRKNRWPDEWFDGKCRRLSAVDLRVPNPVTPDGRKALRLRRQSLKDACARKGLQVKMNWKGTDLIMQTFGPIKGDGGLMNSGPPVRKPDNAVPINPVVGPSVRKGRGASKKGRKNG